MKPCILILAVVLVTASCSESPQQGADASTDISHQEVLSEDVSTVDAGSLDALDAVEDAAPADVQQPIVVTGLTITPSESFAIQVEQGESQHLGLGVSLVYSDGSQVEVPIDEVIWTFSDSNIAMVNDLNEPVATATTGGQVLIVAVHAGLHAQCSLTVQLLIPDPLFQEGMTTADVTAFESGVFGQGDGAPSLLYPLEASVIPRGIKPPLIQWEPGKCAYFRLVLVGADDFSMTLYTTQSQHQPSLDHWVALAGPQGSAVTIELSGAEALDPGGPRLDAPPVSLEIAPADLSGSVYYWEVESGSIMRLDANHYDPGAEPVFEDSGTIGDGKPGVCRGCHTLSRDGSRLAYVFEAKGSGDLGVAWAQNPDPPILAPGSGALASTSSFGPDSTRLAVATELRLWLADVTPGLEGGFTELQEIFVAPGPEARIMTPAWSPDGSALVYSYSPKIAAGVSDLLLRYQDEETGLFGEAQTLFAGESLPGRSNMSYPTWSPDSQYLVAKATAQLLGVAPFSLVMIDSTGSQCVYLSAGSPDTFSLGQPSLSRFFEGGY